MSNRVASPEPGRVRLGASAPGTAALSQGTMRDRLVRTIPPFHDLLFLIFLVAFVGFAIQWALILGG